jgi:RNA polymerase sigma-70 factor (ECF subfamily)
MMNPSSGQALTGPHGLVFADEAAFRAWYEQALPRVYGYLLRRTGDSAWAEELTQQTFLAAVGTRAPFRGEAEPATWLIAIARHALADDLRRRDRRERGLFGIRIGSVMVEPGHDPLASQSDRVDVRAAVASLPALQRAAVILCYVDGLPVRAAAAVIHKSEKATESLLSRARANLRLALGEEEP